MPPPSKTNLSAAIESMVKASSDPDCSALTTTAYIFGLGAARYDDVLATPTAGTYM